MFLSYTCVVCLLWHRHAWVTTNGSLNLPSTNQVPGGLALKPHPLPPRCPSSLAAGLFDSTAPTPPSRLFTLPDTHTDSSARVSRPSSILHLTSSTSACDKGQDTGPY